MKDLTGLGSQSSGLRCTLNFRLNVLRPAIVETTSFQYRTFSWFSFKNHVQINLNSSAVE
jgi:hypothetical protein